MIRIVKLKLTYFRLLNPPLTTTKAWFTLVEIEGEFTGELARPSLRSSSTRSVLEQLVHTANHFWASISFKMAGEHREALRKCIKRVYNALLEEVDEALEEERNRKKVFWMREWTQRRNTRGASALLLSELAVENTKEYMS